MKREEKLKLLPEFFRLYCLSLRDGLTFDALVYALKIPFHQCVSLEREMFRTIAEHNAGLMPDDDDFTPVPLRLKRFKWTSETYCFLETGVSVSELLGVARVK